MCPIPKDSSMRHISEKYRAITLSSIIGKVLDLIILMKESDKSLATNTLQYGFKEHYSTTLCTATLMEVITRFLGGNSHAYGLFLDASKAFDRVDYIKLFHTLESKGMNILTLRCLVNMYTNQKLCVCWNGEKSDYFIPRNGVKQGGVLSPLLFSTYLDGIISSLQDKHSGCFVGPYYMGFIGYADDVCLIAPTISALKSMTSVCEHYAEEYKIMFNGAKSKFVRFCKTKNCLFCSKTVSCVTVCGEILQSSKCANHLGHTVFSNLQDDSDNVVNTFYRQYNVFRSNFKCTPSVMRNRLFQSFCCSFYGIQLCLLSGMKRLCTAYRKCIRDIWRVPYRTLC